MKNQCGVTFTFRHTGSHAGEYRSGKEGFWSPFERGSTQLSSERLHNRFKRRFGLHLQQYFRQAAGGDQLVRPIVVVVKGIHYSSLVVDTVIQPIESIKKLFETLEHFEAFLEAYAPQAFEKAIEAEENARNLIDDLDIAIEVSAQMAHEWNEPHSIATGREGRWQRGVTQVRGLRANWLWIASNMSLVVPVAIAVWFLCAAWRSVDARTDSTDKAYLNLIHEQTALIQQLQPKQAAAQENGTKETGGSKVEILPRTTIVLADRRRLQCREF